MGLVSVNAIRLLLAVQAVQAVVTGTVRDSHSGLPAEGAVVALRDLDRTVVTDSSGRFTFTDVPAGPQHLTVRSLGFAERSLHALVPRQGRLQINVTLSPEPIRLAQVDVQPRVTLRGVEDGERTPFPDREVTIAAVRNHPMLAEPDVLQALAGGMVVIDPESPSGVHVRGGASDHTAYLLDGIPVFSPYHAAGMFSAWNPDALSRLQLSSTAPSPALPDALSGAITAITRTPGVGFRAEGSASTTQLRATVDGSLDGGAGYLVSLRSGFPGVFAPRDDASYLRGETADGLVKVEAPVLGGRLRVLGYGSKNELDAAHAAEVPEDGTSPGARNVFEWRSRSVGGEWARNFSNIALRITGWSAASHVSAQWFARGDRLGLKGARRDEGVVGALEHRTRAATTLVGARLQQSRTEYGVANSRAGGTGVGLRTRTPMAAAFLQHIRAIDAAQLELGVSAAAAVGRVHVSPRAQLRLDVSERIALAGSYARLHQFAQSLRNAESVVGSIFPADLFVGAGAPGVPVAHSDQGVIAARYTPAPGIRLGVQAYLRGFDGLLLVAPSDGEPFATGTFATGSGSSRGLSFEAALSSARYGAVASYSWQHTRLGHGHSRYVPEHGDAQHVEAGVIMFPTATSSLKLGFEGVFGRRTTPASMLEWEACNLRDQGCEFAGSPRTIPDSLGATVLPAYVRVDLGLRKHWHIDVRGRDVTLAAFGTITNLFARRNVLTFASNPLTGEAIGIEMRPLAPLVAGLDWRF